MMISRSRLVALGIVALLVFGSGMATAATARTEKQMSGLEKGIWITINSVAPSVGSVLGASVGVVVVPVIVTSVVGALGISTSGAGFVAAVIIPATPAAGQAVGAAVGAALFSAVSHGLHEWRLQRFRAIPKKKGQLAKDVIKTAFTDGLIAGMTGGLGSAMGGAVANATTKELIVKILKQAGLRLAGHVGMEIFGGAMAGAAGDWAPEPDAGVSPDGSGGTPEPLPDAASSASGEVPVTGGDIHLPPTPTDDEDAPGLSRELEQAAWAGVVSGLVSQFAAQTPRVFSSALALRAAIAWQFWKAPHPAALGR